jgi:hypothetical protein
VGGVDDAFEQHLDLAAAFLVAEKARLDDRVSLKTSRSPAASSRQVGKLPVARR